MLEKESVAATIEQFIRTTFNIEDDTAGFSRTCDLFEGGFVDSIGLIKLISFLESAFGVHIEEDHLFDERFLSIDGESELVSELMNPSMNRVSGPDESEMVEGPDNRKKHPKTG